jgi:hypothetical protein
MGRQGEKAGIDMETETEKHAQTVSRSRRNIDNDCIVLLPDAIRSKFPRAQKRPSQVDVYDRVPVSQRGDLDTLSARLLKRNVGSQEIC